MCVCMYVSVCVYVCTRVHMRVRCVGALLPSSGVVRAFRFVYEYLVRKSRRMLDAHEDIVVDVQRPYLSRK